MFTDDLSENWDSTENQDIFIREYFGKPKVVSKRDQKTSKQANNCNNEDKNNEDNENITYISSQTRNESFMNNDVKPSKKKRKKSSSFSQDDFNTIHENHISSQTRNESFMNNNVKPSKKKRKKSSSFSQDDLNTIHENHIDIEMEDSHITDFNSQKSKKKRKKSRKKKEIAIEEHNSSSERISGQVTYSADSDPPEIDSTHTSDIISNSSSMDKATLIKSKFYQKLQAAKFRYLNEMLYTNAGKKALSYFQQNTDEFQDYHAGYQSQVSKWPINPVDIIIQEIHQMNKQVVIADLGCGEAKIAEVFPKRTVHSFDLIAVKDCVTACDIANVPLPNNSVDVAVFCLSLMGTNWKDYVKESHRILKLDGVLKIAEIESRIEDLKLFIKNIERYGFSLENNNLSHKMFIFLNFKKTNKGKKGSKVPDITLKPCLYKKR